MSVYTSDNVCSVLLVSDLVNDSFSIESYFLLLVFARDVSESREVCLGGFNKVPLEYSVFPAKRRGVSFSEDDTLIFSDSNMFV